MRIAFLTGSSDRSVRDAIERVCEQGGVEPAGILLDTAPTPLARRLRNLWRSTRKHGWSYVWFRFLEAVVAVTDRLVRDAVAKPGDVDALLRRAFPGRCWTLDDVARKYGMAVYEVGSLNSELAASVLRERNADLGVVVGTRILKPRTFGVPRLGSINLHKGRVPEYRGMPPGFWELSDGADTAGVTVHFIDKGLDTGDVVAESTIPIDRLDTPDSLLEKLHAEGARVLASAVAAISRRTRGTAPADSPGDKGPNEPYEGRSPEPHGTSPSLGGPRRRGGRRPESLSAFHLLLRHLLAGQQGEPDAPAARLHSALSPSQRLLP